MFDDFPAIREYLDGLEYKMRRNPVDDRYYAGINADVPDEMRERIRQVIGEPTTLFFRLSVEGVYAPHQAHNDGTMANYTMISYLNRHEHCQGGTSLVRHRDSGMWSGPTDEEMTEVWEQDMNKPEKWEIHQMYHMEENKTVLFDSNWFHRSEPDDGFGDGPSNGRLVLVGFFDDITPSKI